MQRQSRWRKALVAGLGILALATLGVGGWVLTRPGGLWDYFRVAMSLRGEFGPRGRRTQVESDARNILTVVQAFRRERGRWPGSIAEVVGPTSPDGEVLMASLEKLPHDPWGNEYLYEIVDGAPRVTCLGSDGLAGGDGEAADVLRPLEDQGFRP